MYSRIWVLSRRESYIFSGKVCTARIHIFLDANFRQQQVCIISEARTPEPHRLASHFRHPLGREYTYRMRAEGHARQESPPRYKFLEKKKSRVVVSTRRAHVPYVSGRDHTSGVGTFKFLWYENFHTSVYLHLRF